MKIHFTFLFSLLFIGFSYSQQHAIRGFIVNKSSAEPILFEKVYLLELDSSIAGSATSDVDGFYNIPKVNIGSYILKVENGTFKKHYENIKVTKADGFSTFNIQLEEIEKSTNIEEFVVSAQGKINKTQTSVSVIKLKQADLERIPSMGAENDIIGAFSVTPGVVTTGDQGGQMYVRGGTPIQNKVLLDGMTIYNPFHSIGFFSIFETELIKNVDIHTGGFDAKYGGRISSIMDVTYRDGNKKEFGGKVSVSPFLAKVVLEGPIKKRKDGEASSGSYILSAKHSLLDYTSKSLYPTVNDGNGLPFNFTDLYGKVSYNGGDGSKVSAFAFHNQDSVNFYNVADLDFKSSGGGINFIIVSKTGDISTISAKLSAYPALPFFALAYIIGKSAVISSAPSSKNKSRVLSKT